MLYWILNWHNKFAHSCSFGVLSVSFGLNNIYFIILYMYNYYIATRNDTQYNEWDTEESQ